MTSDHQYDAFLSYSRGADGSFAEAVVGAARAYVGFRRGEQLRIFRDKESLTAAPALSAELERNLALSRRLVLLASPGAAASSYVGDEVAWWLTHRDIDKIVVVLTARSIVDGEVDGLPDNALPPPLAMAYREPPLYIDCTQLRAAAGGWTLRDPAFADKVAELVAVLTDQSKDLVRGQRLDVLRRESELLATRIMENPPADGELYLLLAIEAVSGVAPSARSVLALHDALASSPLRQCFVGHHDEVTACRFVADGQRFVTGSRDGTARLWSLATGEALTTYEHDAAVMAVAVADDESLVATAVADGSTHVWRLHDAAPVCVLEGHEGAVTSVAFSPDGASLLTVSEDRSARLWRIPDGQLLHILRKRNRILRGRDREPRSGVFSPADSGVVVTGAWGFRLLVWDARRGRLKRKLWGTFGPDVDVSPDGARIVAPSDAGVRIWDLHSRAKRWTVDLGDHREDVTSVAFALDGTHVVSSAQHEVRITPSDGEGAPIAIPVPQGIADARLSPDGSLLLGACLDRTARVWEPWPREEAVTIGPVTLLSVSATSLEGSFVTHAPGHPYTLWDVAGRRLGVLGPDPGGVAVAAFGPGGQVVACAGSDAVVSLWHAHDASPVATWPCGHGETQSLCFSPDGSVLLSGDADGTVTSWTAATGSPAVLAATRPGPVSRLRWSPRGDRVVAVHRDRSDLFRGALLDAADGAVIVELDEHVGWNDSLDFAPDGAQFATAAEDGKLRTYDSETGTLVWTADHEEPLTDLAYSPDGTMVATTTKFGSDAFLWDRTTGDPVLRLRHPEWVSQACFSSDSAALLLLGSRDVYVWDLREAELVNVLHGHTNVVRTGRFVASDRRIVTAASDGTVRIWDNPTLDELAALARSRTFRPLTDEERTEFGLGPQDERQRDGSSIAGTTDAAIPTMVTRTAHRPPRLIPRV